MSSDRKPLKSALTKSRAEAMLASMRANFVANLPEKFDGFEQLILHLASEDGFAEQFDELFRRIHSLKGSAGTHGLQGYTNICHQFEDQLRQVDGRFDAFNPELVNTWLKYVDLMREVLDVYQKAPDDGRELCPEFNEVVRARLEALRQHVYCNGLTAMIVASSRSIESICLNIVKNLNFNFSLMNDGYLALGRLLNEKIDVLITTREVSGLNGNVLIAAIKLAHKNTRPTKTILLTSESDVYSGRFSDPDITIARDIHLAENLTDALNRIVPRRR